jgi:hypothetical protein
MRRAVVVIALVGLACGVASASQVTMSNAGESPALTVTIVSTEYFPNGVGALTGVYNFSNATGAITGNFSGFCIEMQYSGGANKTYDLVQLQAAPEENGPSGDPMGWAKAQKIRQLWDWFESTKGYDPTSTASAVEAAAFQLAIWNTVYDSDTSLSAGSFRTGNDPSGVRSVAEGYITSAASHSGYATLIALTNPDYQDYVVEYVPLPPAALLGLGLLGGLAVVRRFRR